MAYRIVRVSVSGDDTLRMDSVSGEKTVPLFKDVKSVYRLAELCVENFIKIGGLEELTTIPGNRPFSAPPGSGQGTEAWEIAVSTFERRELYDAYKRLRDLKEWK